MPSSLGQGRNSAAFWNGLKLSQELQWVDQQASDCPAKKSSNTYHCPSPSSCKSWISSPFFTSRSSDPLLLQSARALYFPGDCGKEKNLSHLAAFRIMQLWFLTAAGNVTEPNQLPELKLFQETVAETSSHSPNRDLEIRRDMDKTHPFSRKETKAGWVPRAAPSSGAVTPPPTSWFPSSSSVSEQLDRYWWPDHSSSPSQISRDWDIPGQPARQRGAQLGTPAGTEQPEGREGQGREGVTPLWGLLWGDTSPLSSSTGLLCSESFSSELMEALCCFLNDWKITKSISVSLHERTQTPRAFVK